MVHVNSTTAGTGYDAEPIVVNGRFLSISQPTGVQRSAYFLLEALAERSPALRILCPEEISFPLPLSPRMSAAVEIVPGPVGMHRQLWEQIVFPRVDPEFWHVNLMGTSSVVFGADRNLSLIHDLNYDLIPEAYDWRFRLWYKVACGTSARFARKLVSNSAYTRDMIRRFLGDAAAAKCEVLRFGPGVRGDLLQAQAAVDREDFLLCVGSLQPHKNLGNVLRAYAQIRSEGFGVRLKVVGRKQGFFNALNIPRELLEQPGVEFTGYVDDGALARLYGTALAFVFPSFEEGFGLPVVEAFYAGCPVITSNRSCLPEIAGDAAWLVDPHRPEAIAEGMRVFLTDSAAREEAARRGRQRSALYQWTQAAETLLSHLRSGGL